MTKRIRTSGRSKSVTKFRLWRGYKLEVVKKQAIIHVSFSQYLKLIGKLLHLLLVSRYKPDIIICIATGGLYGAIVARSLGIRYGVWMAQGYRTNGKTLVEKQRSRTFFADNIAFIDRRSKKAKKRCPWPFKRVLLIDDLDDSGATFHRAVRLLRDWYGYEFEIRTMSVFHKVSSNFFVDYVSDCIPVDEATGTVPWIHQPHEEITRQLAEGILPLKRLF